MSSPSPSLFVVGELNVDLILDRVNALPQLGAERIAEGMRLVMGSSSAILAANAAALGVPTAFVGCVGRDAFGRVVLDRLAERGVDAAHVVALDDVATGLTAIYTHGGDRGMLTYPGAMERLTLAHVPWDAVAQAAHLHVSSYYLQPGLRPDVPALFERARQLGLTTSFDTNWDPDEAWGDDVLAVLDHVDVFLPNDAEARLIAGTDDLGEALDRLAARAGAVVVTCGADGVVAARGDERLALPTVPVMPVDAVGAGDSFNAGFLSRFVAGAPFEACLHAGLVAGAFSTTAGGGTAAFDDHDAYSDFAARAEAGRVPHASHV